MTATESNEAPIISIQNVWKFFGQLTALHDVSFDVQPGERVVIIGPSGSGKSHRIYEEIMQRAAQEPGRNFLIIVPDQFTMQTQKDLVMRSDRGGILNIDVLSFGRLSHRILEEVGTKEMPVLDDTGKSLVLQKIAADLKEQLPAMGSLLHKQGYIHEVKSAISEFMQYGISTQDMDKLKLSLQGYNYGNGYITWALRNYGGYSVENALQFSNEQAASHGWSAYGDPEYVPHVLRYYSSGGLFAGLFGGNGQIVSVALTQLGNEGGQKFWSWYGFDSHVAWCACFASWCGDQAGLIESGKMPKFSLCDDGIAWFQSKGKWKSRGYSPAPGTLIFFDWNGDGTPDHVGIVEKTEGSTVYTVEGNSSDAVNQRSYDINNGTIMGYGIL